MSQYCEGYKERQDRTEQLERELNEANEKLNQTTIDKLGHEYALEVLNEGVGLPRENESYLRILEEYQAIYNRCQQAEILERESKAELSELKRQIAEGELVHVELVSIYTKELFGFGLAGLKQYAAERQKEGGK